MMAGNGFGMVLAALLAAPLGAQEPNAPEAPEVATQDEGKNRAWQFAAYLDVFVDPEDSTTLAPTVFADRGRLHFEGRYNYEDLDTASLFAGWTFTFEEHENYLNLTPMIGGFAGQSNGIAPGLEVEARWKSLAYWLEAEYAFNPGDPDADFFYSWSELNLFLRPYLWVGGSVQRLKVVETPREVDVGPMVGFGWSETPSVSLSLYFYGIGTSTHWYLATLSAEF